MARWRSLTRGDELPEADATGAALRAGPPREHTSLRDHLEYIAVLILVVLLLRQVVVEAFRIRHGSMAPTLVGEHNEVRCPNCGWVFTVGRDKVGFDGDVECPNCRYSWGGGSDSDEQGRPIVLKRPAWLWNEGFVQGGAELHPTAAANRVLRGASRVFVNKFVYYLRNPRRWEVAVFVYPYYSVRCRYCDWRGEFTSMQDAVCPECGHSDFDVETKSFIKRVIGLPGETVSLKDGDVYINGHLERKPLSVQERMWMHVFDSEFTPQREIVPTWDFGAGAGRWGMQPPGGALTVRAREAEQSVMATFARRIVDFYPYDGVSFERSPGSLGAAGRYEVGDCRVLALVRAGEHDSDADVRLQIEDAGHSFTFSVGLGPAGGALLRDEEVTVGQAEGVRLPEGQPVWLTLENCDDCVTARIGDRTVFRQEYRSRPGYGAKSVRVGARGADAMWERVIIQRDVYYNSVERYGTPTTEYELGRDEYFVLGDNSPASSDSRRWPHAGVPARNMIGQAFFVFWPVHDMKFLGNGAH
jgi:predicted Zn finger-like uncharacterized protein